ncbi:MAG: cysteine desulfurase [Bifidobacteriaceae bacterium]|jgi:cysteine desulfurase/selenocysteine lyase|nr:cysteine desulfurase [Bifidobacteriaceae bacterium]
MKNISQFRDYFPEIETLYNNKPLVYLDTAASALKPKTIIEAANDFSLKKYSNISRGISRLSADATELYEESRQKVLKFVTGQTGENKLLITSGATASLNMAANYYYNKLLPKDEILLSIAEHHSNILPWMELVKKTGAVIKWVDIDHSGELHLSAVAEKITSKTRVVALTHVSNITGSITPVKDIARLVHKAGADFVLDAAQSVGHIETDFLDIDCDMAAFSAHKVYGPTGLGFLYCKNKIVENFPNFFVGGGTVDDIVLSSAIFSDSDLDANITNADKTNALNYDFELIYKDGLARLEAGTPPISQLIAFAEVIDLLNNIGLKNIENYEKLLTKKLLDLGKIPDIKILGSKNLFNRIGIISFVSKNIHPHDLGQFLDDLGIVCRAGHNCAIPIHKRFKENSSIRFSLGLYNNEDDIEKAIDGVKEAQKFFISKR